MTHMTTQKFRYLYLFLFLLSCSFFENYKYENSSIISPQFNDTLFKEFKSIKSGRYGDVSIAIDSLSNLTGVYEFYNAWDESFQEYLQINVFYFYGNLENGNNKITAGWPGIEDKIDGQFFSINDKIYLQLNEMPYGYAAVDFVTDSGYSAFLDSEKEWNQIRIIKSLKTFLYKIPDSTISTKAYLIKDDIVKVLAEGKNNWLKIEYNSASNRKSSVGWINKNSLYSSDPISW